MVVTFTDGSSGVFIAKVPSPGVVIPLLAAAGVAMCRRDRR